MGHQKTVLQSLHGKEETWIQVSSWEGYPSHLLSLLFPPTPTNPHSPSQAFWRQCTKQNSQIWESKNKEDLCFPGGAQFSQFSCSVMSDSLRPHESQHARPPCPLPTPRVHSVMPIESVIPSSHLILCCPLFLLPPIPPSIRVFSNESTLHMRWPKYWNFSFSISPSNEHSGLISFRMDWLDLLAVQGTLKSLLQHHSSKASVLRCSAFFIVQLSHPYMTTGKTIALTRQTFVGKVMSLLFNMLSRLVVTFLPRSKRLLISWLQSPSAVILEPKKWSSVLAKSHGTSQNPASGLSESSHLGIFMKVYPHR